MSSPPPKIKPGDIVLTPFGVAVITCTKVESSALSFRCRLNRIPGDSLASSSEAVLRKDSIIKKLPVAPGMATTTVENPSKTVLIHSYSVSRDVYLVTEKEAGAEEASTESSLPQPPPPKPLPMRLVELKPCQLNKAPSAKFYPLLENLMARGEEAAKTTTAFVQRTVSDADVKKLLPSSTLTDGITTKANDLISETNAAMPDKEQMESLLKMMKDEEFTVLLQKGQERLKQLLNTDIPQFTSHALKQTGITLTGNSLCSLEETSTAGVLLKESQEKAYQALNDLLQTHNMSDMSTIRNQLQSKFETVFDTLTEAANSDRTLNGIYDTLTEKSSEWQELSGRLMQTKSVGLFVQGTTRLQTRTMNLLSTNAPKGSPTMQWNGSESLTRLTKAFTEGDAAVARLKGIELGDSLRKRLIGAIELRSGSEGGLDSIIAGVLGTVEGSQKFMGELQKGAESRTKAVNETLIAALSHQSVYRGKILIKVEETMVDMEQQLKDFFGLDIEGFLCAQDGEEDSISFDSSEVFGPIAKRAALEIEKQLDLAEKQFTKSPHILIVLGHVRKILQGELSLNGLMDEVEKILNDDQVVAYGEKLLVQSEELLDQLENFSSSGNTANSPAMTEYISKIMEKTGLTKEAVLEQIQLIDINTVIDTAEDAMSDKSKRTQLLSNATDSALDFILRILPSMPVPPLDGVKDGLLYKLGNLSMEGFMVKKEDIVVEIAGVRAVKWEDKKSEENDEEEGPNSICIESTAKSEYITELNGNEQVDDGSNKDENEDKPQITPVKATELLIIDVKNISAILEDVTWSYEQTYFPYLKGEGKANVKLSEGSILLKFELRKRLTSKKDEEPKWEPVLCLHERDCFIGSIDLVLKGNGRITWLLNKLASIFKGALRDYVVRTIIYILGNKSGVLLRSLNDGLSPYWDIILMMSELKMDDLAELSDQDLTDAEPNPYENEVELVWTEHLPLGMNLLLNDSSGNVKVIDFPRGSQARNVAQGRNLDPDIFKGATITAVNGARFDDKEQEDVIEVLKEAGRPKCISFMLANSEDAEKVKSIVQDMADETTEETTEAINTKGKDDQEGDDCNDEEYKSTLTVVFEREGSLGIDFANSTDDSSLIVSGFSKDEDGNMLLAEKCGKICIGQVLVSINDTVVVGEDGKGRNKALQLFETEGATRPLTLQLSNPYLKHLSVDKTILGASCSSKGGPVEEFSFAVNKTKKEGSSSNVSLQKFMDIAGAAESAGVFIGDHLVFISGMPVGAGTGMMRASSHHHLEHVTAMLQDESQYPLTLTFARPKEGRRWKTSSASTSKASNMKIDNVYTFSVAVNELSELGCVFERGANLEDVIVSRFHAVMGPVQKRLTSNGISSKSWIGNTLDSIDGQIVPKYATVSMITNALRRAWADSNKVDLCFLDEKRRTWLMDLSTTADITK